MYQVGCDWNRNKQPGSGESLSEELEAGVSIQNGGPWESEWASHGTSPLRVGRVILPRQIP